MSEPSPTQAPPVFNLNAYSPTEIQDAVERVGVSKANMPVLPSFMLAVVAGGSIGLGALYYMIVASDPALGFAATRVLGGVVFSLGLALVLVGGAELFTGNNLIVMAWASRRISTRKVLRNWVVVYCGNFVGAIGVVALVLLSQHLDMNGGQIRRAILIHLYREEKVVEDQILHAKLYFNMVDALRAAGGDVTTTAVDFAPHVIEDRELITGQNPRSDHPLAARFVAALDRSLAAA